ncbi:MAG: hypothetical protein IT159_14485 [Bryobacterales bacterium]|nr:hypothetical protein [Bryobacterales bacterium]
MKIQQLSLFLENKPGCLLEPCRLLAEDGINIRALTLADTREFGILRLIVSDSRRAAALFTERGYVVNVTEVLAIEVPDRPGGLVHLLETIGNSEINIEYMYAFPSVRSEKAVLLFRFSDPDAAMARLQAAGISVVESVEIVGPGGRG